jgi:Taurine catabolism dioxygenase TauD, TfdA family
MSVSPLQAEAAWSAAQLSADGRWIFELDHKARSELTQMVRSAHEPGKPLFDYRRDDFDFGSAWRSITAALEETKHGRGTALVKGLPRAELDHDEFRLLTWAIGLHAGVARPQGKSSHYLSEVRDIGTAYRTGGGRGYSSNAELDFHTDSADLVVLTCYNKAASGGMSLISSSLAAHERMAAEHPRDLDFLHQPIHFSRQREQALDEGPSYAQPIFDEAGGKLFSRWNRNRVDSAQRLEGVPRISPAHREALERFDCIVRREDVAYSFYLQPGDMQLVNSHVTLHSRTDFVDHVEPAQKRLLFRLWLATPDSECLPETWRASYRSIEPGAVRGGIRGQEYDDRCRSFDSRQAADLGMHPS